ncbi:MAG: ribbon-helix-helix protein, CopG family [bacterium]|nr:ribbon-helix-helix protein, CopG family [bacterium]
MTKKVVAIASSPRAGDARKSAEAWVRCATPGRPFKRLTVEVDEALHRRLRLRAAGEGRSMTAIVRELLEGGCPE